MSRLKGGPLPTGKAGGDRPVRSCPAGCGYQTSNPNGVGDHVCRPISRPTGSGGGR